MDAELSWTLEIMMFFKKQDKATVILFYVFFIPRLSFPERMKMKMLIFFVIYLYGEFMPDFKGLANIG